MLLFFFVLAQVRFRWRHAYLESSQTLNSPPWGIDDVYIGPQCPDHCHGHGACVDGGLACSCDAGYQGDTCHQVTGQPANPSYLHQVFLGSPSYT